MVLPNGYRRTTGDPSIGADPRRARVPDGGVLAVSASLMRPEKGHADLLDAVRFAARREPLVVAMAGDGPLFEEIRSTVNADPVLSQRIRLLGFRSGHRRPDRRIDFVVQPSLEDALPTSRSLRWPASGRSWQPG